MRTLLAIIFVLFAGKLLAQTSAWLAPASAQELTNPLPHDQSVIAEGMKLFVHYCAPCHGLNKNGYNEPVALLDPPPADLASNAVQQQPDGALYWKISEGRGNMPAWKYFLSETQRWQVIHYVRELAGKGDNKMQDVAALEPPVQDTVTPVKIADNKRKFLLAGSAYANAELDAEMWNEAGFATGFSPLLLWRPSGKLFFESHLHVMVEGGTGTSGHTHSHGTTSATGTVSNEIGISVGYANLVYFLNKHITFTGGYFLSPFGIYAERLHPEWVNKLPDVPLGMDHHNPLGPAAELGFQVRGTFLPHSRINYSVYVTNGPALNITGEEAGRLTYGITSDNNRNKATGFRVGVRPLPGVAAEVGFSGQFGKVGPSNTIYEGIYANMYAGDLSLYKNIKSLHGALNLKAQLNYIKVENAWYTFEDTHRTGATFHTGGPEIYYFENTSHAGFVQLSFRAGQVKNKFLKNIEAAGRFDEINLPEGSLWERDDRRWTVGLNYWLNFSSAFKIAWQSGEYGNKLMGQFVIGF